MIFLLLLVDKKVMGRVAIPAFLALWALHVLCVVACGTVCLVWRCLKVFIGAVALEAFDIIEAMHRVVPIFVNLWSDLLVALAARGQFFLLCKLRMSRNGSAGSYHNEGYYQHGKF